ncbi:hypothetical protein [Cryobacterium sp. SO1]|uniref:hypothetical protein n=1 Tax=Cryobacterium sp. SO1 TaxID=1897061 RepID=UPI0010E13891|nr:hypothetical protein [Cryobacterium sp. SO1]RZI35464.1 hypothetical protein BJQ95_02152 [Cryobacterium sp. SO1]
MLSDFLFSWLGSVLVLGVGLWASLAAGEWIAVLCVAGPVILPIGGLALRAQRPYLRSQLWHRGARAISRARCAPDVRAARIAAA